MRTAEIIGTAPDASREPGDWDKWRSGRLEAARAPHGIASATVTAWLDREPRRIEGAPGLWSSDGEAIRVTGVGAPDLEIAAGDSAPLGDLRIQAVRRNGKLAARVFDPAARNRTALEGIDAYEWDPAWRVTGTFDPSPQRLRVQQVDGGEADFPVAGRLAFSVDGRELSLLGFRTDRGLQVTFADETNGSETAQFRFLDVELASGHGSPQSVVLDFNRAYLPPCSFGPAYLCPLPPLENRLTVSVRAGERRQRYADESLSSDVRFDDREYRDAMGGFASGVTVITTLGAGAPVGFTCQSFTSVSIDPPLVSFSIARTSRSLSALQAHRRVVINFLGADQRHLSNQFAKSGTDKWEGVEWRPAPANGAPVLDGGTGWIAGEIDREIEAGDHIVFLLRVTGISTDPSRAPLLFYRGSYHEIEYQI